MGRNENVERNEIYNPKKKRRKNILKPNQIGKRERERGKRRRLNLFKNYIKKKILINKF